MNAINIKVKVSYKEKKFVIGTGYQTEQQIIKAIRDRIDSLKSDNSIFLTYQSGAKSLQQAYKRCIQNNTTLINVIVQKHNHSMSQDQQDVFQHSEKNQSNTLVQSGFQGQKQTQIALSASRINSSNFLSSQSKKKMLRFKKKTGENIEINLNKLETQKYKQFLPFQNKSINNNKDSQNSGQFEKDIQNKHKELSKKHPSDNQWQITTATVNGERNQGQSTAWITNFNKKELQIQIQNFTQNNQNYQNLDQLLQVSSIVQNQSIIQRLIARIQQVQNAFRQQNSQFNVILREQSTKISFLEKQNQILKLKLEQVQDSNLKLLRRLNQIQNKYLKLSSQNILNQQFSSNISPQDIAAFKSSSIQKSILSEKKNSIKSNSIQWTPKESKSQPQQISKTQIKNLDAQITQIQKLPSIKVGDIVQFKINIKNNGLQRWPQKIFIHERISNKISQLKSLSSGQTINFADQPMTTKRQGQNIQIKYQLFYEAENSQKRYFGNLLSIFHKVKRNDGSKVGKMEQSSVMDKNPSNYSNSNIEKKKN